MCDGIEMERTAITAIILTTTNLKKKIRRRNDEGGGCQRSWVITDDMNSSNEIRCAIIKYNLLYIIT